MNFQHVIILAAAVFIATPVMAQLRPVDRAPQSRAATTQPSPDMAKIAAASGIFDLVASKGPNSCRITLWPEGAKGNFPVSFPAGCRKAFPFLAKVKTWTLIDDTIIRLGDDKLASIIEFNQKDGKLISGEINQLSYELKPGDSGWFKRQAKVSQTSAAASIPQANIEEINKAAGTYDVVRVKGKLAGCRLVFSSQAAAKAAEYRVGLLDGCQDSGMQIFSPVSWRLEAGKLVLISRKGHNIVFIRSPTSGWSKEKQSGDSLELTR